MKAILVFTSLLIVSYLFLLISDIDIYLDRSVHKLSTKYDNLPTNYEMVDYLDVSDNKFDDITITNNDQVIFPISKKMIITDSVEFLTIAKHYLYLMNTKFTEHQLKGLKTLVISDSESFGERGEYDSASGLYNMDNKASHILIAAYSDDNDRVLYHELCHVMYFDYYDEFLKIKKEWLKSNIYVTEYATTDIDEDFAETGSFYLCGEIDEDNPKFKLFEEFFNNIK